MTATPARTGTALVLSAVFMVAACQTARIQDIAPQSATPQASAPLPAPSSAQAASTAPAPAVAAGQSSETASAEQAQEGRPPPGWPPPDAARDTGTYPNLNVPLPVATAQITDSQEAASKAELNALKQRAQGTAAPKVTNQAALRKLGQSRAEQVLKEIEDGGELQESAD